MNEVKQSGAGVCLHVMLSMTDNSLVSSKILYKGRKHLMSKNSAGAFLHKMKHYGAVVTTEVYGQFRIHSPKLKKYRDEHTTQGRKLPIGARKGHGKGSKNLPAVVPKDSDYDIIENLLTAMAAAEPILRRYKKLDKFVKTFNELS